MFFMMGITSGRKDLDFHQMMICSRCGRYGNYSVYMTYMVLSLFFIPCFKWNRRYYVTSSCCGASWQLDPEVGRRIAGGEQVEIRPENLTPVDYPAERPEDYHRRLVITKRCSNCGFTTEEDYDFCPKCGRRI